MRVTIKDLERLTERVNRETNSPLTGYTWDDDAKSHQNAGHYYLAMAYGGYKLERLSEHGSSDISTDGYGTKKQLYKWIHAFLDGMAIAKDM